MGILATTANLPLRGVTVRLPRQANYTPQKYLAGTDGWNPVG